MSTSDAPLTVQFPASGGTESVLSDDAKAFLVRLVQRFGARRDQLLAVRQERQAARDAGEAFAFLPETAEIRAADWRIAPLPKALQDRRVEITGPVDRKMVINGLNSGAQVFMADFEDATSPTFDNLVQGQRNLIDAVNGSIRHVDPQRNKTYSLVETPAVLMVRPRGLHLPEAHVLVNGKPIPGALFDFGVFFFHNAKALAARGLGPFFYLPKLESHHEAKWWDDVLGDSEEALGLPRGTARATVLIETLPAAFEMDEILYALKDHAAGLNCGRWDYIFSFIKAHRTSSWSLPDRRLVGMDRPFMRAYTQLVVKTCHRRGASAMGGMAAQIPIKDDVEKNRIALEKVAQDKRREAKDGHDGTWVAHPGLVALARDVFNEQMPGPNQLQVLRDDVNVQAEELVAKPEGPHTDEGLRHNLRVGVQYLAAWLDGRGCVPLEHLMEDAATAEISRTQVWQWVARGTKLEDGRRVTAELVERTLREEIDLLGDTVVADPESTARRPSPGLTLQSQAPPSTSEALASAESLFLGLATRATCADFLTLPAYEELLKRGL